MVDWSWVVAGAIFGYLIGSWDIWRMTKPLRDRLEMLDE